jgi:ketosteroid isomerase-like protein
MRTLATLLLLALLLASCTTVQGTSGLEMAVAKSAADSLWTHYAEAIDRHDAVGLGVLFAEGAVLDFSNAPTKTGPAAIQAFLDSLYRNFDATGFRVRPDVFKVAGTIAVQGGAFEEDGSMAGKPATREYGRYVMVMERGDDGVWRMARLTAIADSLRPLP